MAEATISECGRYCYTLTREGWMGGEGTVLFVMLNPSTADAQKDDPTIRRCIGFAQRWGYRRLTVGNLYAYRATDPAGLWTASDNPGAPIGEFPWPVTETLARNRNDSELEQLAAAAGLIVAAWGANPGPITGRGEFVLDCLQEAGGDVHCLEHTAQGHPRHPLYVRGDKELEPFTTAEARAEAPNTTPGGPTS